MIWRDMILGTFLLGILAAELPVRWDKTGDLSDVQTLEQVSAAMKKPLHPNGEDGLNVSKDGVQTLATNCEEYLSLTKQGFSSPGTTFDVSQESFFKARCIPLKRLLEAKSSGQSFLDSYKFTPDSLKDFPPCIGGMGGDSSYASKLKRAMEGGTSWQAFDPAKKVTKTRPSGMSFRGGGEEIDIDFVVWGDFNGDRIEDVLAIVGTHATEGSYRSFEQAILSRKQGERLFRIVFSETDSCKSNMNTTYTGCSWDRVDRERTELTRLFAAKDYSTAYAKLRRVKEECFDTLSDERRLWFLSDMSLAALKAGDPNACLKILNETKTNEALDWDMMKPARKAIAYNRGLCEAAARK